MDYVYAILTLAGCVVAVVIVLTFFYKLLEACQKKPKKLPLARKFHLAGVVDANTIINVHLSNGKIFERVRCLSFTSDQRSNIIFCCGEGPQANEDDLPPEFSDVLVLEDAAGTRFLSPTRMVQLVEIPSANSK